ncbi:MAG: hypothetical protein AAFP87_21010 [Pseudomonadota bacterium]
MKPNFALSLSFDGIRLLLRAAGGWRLVGEVPVTSSDLAGDLALLRAKAVALRPGRVRSKLIIPDDQIRYLSVDTGDVDRDARIAAARVALEGATPYAVDALAFDICEDGATTHVAAVARETLTEAEAFATEHRFHPVSFVAAPLHQAFLGEPYFGKTAHAVGLLKAGQDVEPDGVCVVVVGNVDETETDATLAPPQEAASNAVPKAKPEVETEPETEATPEAVAEPQTEAEEETASTAEREDTTAPPAQDAVALPPAGPDTPAVPPAPPQPDPAPDDVDDASTLMLFSHRQRPEIPDAPGSDMPAAVPPAPPEPMLDFEPDETTQPPAPFASRRGPDARPMRAAVLGGVTRDAPAPVNAPQVTVPPPAVTPDEQRQAATDSLQPADPPPELIEDTQPPAPAARSDRLSGFLSLRKARRAAPAQPALPPQGLQDEAKRMTVFGAREGAGTGRSRYTGLVLTAVLLLFLAGVAAWASVFLDDKLASLFPERERTLASTLPDDVEDALAADVGATTVVEPDDTGTNGQTVAALNDSIADGLTQEDAAVLDALRDPLPEPQAPEELDAAALDARYAVTGIWPKAPDLPQAPDVEPAEDLYVTGIDPISPALDAIALPSMDDLLTDVALPDIPDPAAPGTDFTRDDAGRIIPTTEGALSPDGFTVFLGAPPLTPPVRPGSRDSAEEPAPTIDAANAALAALRPRSRPTDLVEQNERATLGGLLRSELATYRPRLRPRAPQEEAAPAEEDAEEVDPAAPVVALPTEPMLRPEGRPRNFNRVVARAQRQQQREAAAAPATRTASVAPRAVTPAIPSTASVAREATVPRAINLRRVNLIGVYGTPSDRRALVRLANGRYQKVQVGDRFDGGRVSAIGDNELRYQKGGRNVVLKMPSG